MIEVDLHSGRRPPITVSVPKERDPRQWSTLQIWNAIIRPRFHVQMAYTAAALLVVSLVGCRLTAIKVPYAGPIALAVLATMAAVQVLPTYWHSKGKTNLRDASLTIPWALLFWAILPFPTDLAARLSAHVSLQDAHFVRLDEALGVSVPAIMRWCAQHWIGGVVNRTYAILAPLIAFAFLLPSLTGRVKPARQFLTGNLVAFIVGLPVFALLPAVGPWSGYHLAPTPSQIQCQSDLFQLRSIGTYVHHANGVICFPSFHVMWAILCAQALWGFRFLRIPVSLLSGLIVISTMTSGWHYFSDVLGGILLAAAAMLVSKWLYQADERMAHVQV